MLARMTVAVLCARARMPVQRAGAVVAALAIVVIALDVADLGPDVGVGGAVLVGIAVAFVAVSLATTLAAPAAGGEPLEVDGPVAGAWLAINSPSTAVPSHGTHGYGQTYAVDLIAVPDGAERPEFGTAAFLAPERFPAYGRAVHAPAAGEVVRVLDGVRDHRSRSSWLGLAWFFVESAPRELLGARGMLGNHVVLRLADGTHFVIAHLRRGSVAVRVGDTVAAGVVIAECGNTGNSTEPHVHCQRQDVADTTRAVGLPWTIRGTRIPATGETATFTPAR